MWCRGVARGGARCIGNIPHSAQIAAQHAERCQCFHADIVASNVVQHALAAAQEQVGGPAATAAAAGGGQTGKAGRLAREHVWSSWCVAASAAATAACLAVVDMTNIATA